MSTIEKISQVAAQLPEKNQLLVLQLMRTMIHPDDYLSEEDEAAIEKARAEIARGEFIRHEDIDWDNIGIKDPTTIELEAIERARKSRAKYGTVRHEDIDWD